MDKIKLHTREDNFMSLSCNAKMIIIDGVVDEIDFSGMERSGGIDNWTGFYKRKNRGDKVSKKEIQDILKYHGRNNIVSVMEKQ